TQINLRKRREFWMIVGQMPPMTLTLDAGAAVALIAQVQIAHRCQPEPGLLAANAQGLAKLLIARFPAPVATMMTREWERPRITEEVETAPAPVKRTVTETPVATCNPPPRLRTCFRLCGQLLVAAAAILAWRACEKTRRLLTHR